MLSFLVHLLYAEAGVQVVQGFERVSQDESLSESEKKQRKREDNIKRRMEEMEQKKKQKERDRIQEMAEKHQKRYEMLKEEIGDAEPIDLKKLKLQALQRQAENLKARKHLEEGYLKFEQEYKERVEREKRAAEL